MFLTMFLKKSGVFLKKSDRAFVRIFRNNPANLQERCIMLFLEIDALVPEILEIGQIEDIFRNNPGDWIHFQERVNIAVKFTERNSNMASSTTTKSEPAAEKTDKPSARRKSQARLHRPRALEALQAV